jgi:hypothetical protein
MYMLYRDRQSVDSCCHDTVFLPETMQEEILQATRFHHPTTTRVECYRQLRSATKYHKELLRCHRELRHQSLLCLKEIRSSEGNLEAAQIIRKIIRHEIHNEDLAVVRALRHPKGPPKLSKQELYLKQWQTINPVFHLTERSKLSTIEIPYCDSNCQLTDDPNRACTWQTVSDPMEIEE